MAFRIHGSGGRSVTKSPKSVEALRKARARLRLRAGSRPAELQGFIDALIIENGERRRAEGWLRESEEKYRAIVESFEGYIFIHASDYRITFMNDRLVEAVDHDGTGDACYRVLHGLDSVCEWCNSARVLSGESVRWELQKDDSWYYISSTPVRRPDGNHSVMCMIQDVTELKTAEMALKKREEELEAKSREIEETNAALRVLLKRREQDRKNLEESIVCNVKEMLLPCVEKLKKTPLDSRQRFYAETLETNLDEIASPFMRSLSLIFSGLTPTEIQVASFVRAGWSAEKISEMLNVSINTVKFHKLNLRSKLGLRNKPVNLRSYLQSLSRE